LRSLIVAFEPSFMTSVEESTFSVFPERVSVFFERSRFSTVPLSCFSERVAVEAVPLLVSCDPVLAVPLEPGLDVLPGVPVLDGLEVLEPVDELVPLCDWPELLLLVP
jgi:hypothetical protein